MGCDGVGYVVVSKGVGGEEVYECGAVVDAISLVLVEVFGGVGGPAYAVSIEIGLKLVAGCVGVYWRGVVIF